MPVYSSLRFLDDDLQLLYARKLSDRKIPARKRRKRSKHQMSYAISAGTDRTIWRLQLIVQCGHSILAKCPMREIWGFLRNVHCNSLIFNNKADRSHALSQKPTVFETFLQMRTSEYFLLLYLDIVWILCVWNTRGISIFGENKRTW